MIIVFRFQCSSCINGFLTSFHSRIQSFAMFLISFRSQVIYYSRSRLDSFIQTILGFLGGQRFLIQQFLSISDQSFHGRLRTAHVICTQISNLEVIKQRPICGQRLRSRRHLHTETQFSVFTHITLHSHQIARTIGHNQLSTLLAVADIFAFQVRTSGCQLCTILTDVFILQTVGHMRKLGHSVVSIHVCQHVVGGISFYAPGSRPSGISRRTIETLHTDLVSTRRQAVNFLVHIESLLVAFGHVVPVFQTIVVWSAQLLVSPSIGITCKVRIRQQAGYVIRIACFQSIQNTSFPDPVSTRLDTVYFRRVKSTLVISFFQTNQVLLIIKKILVCIYGFIPCHRQVVCLCRQCLISSNI